MASTPDSRPDRLVEVVKYYTGVVHTCRDNIPIKELSPAACFKKILETVSNHQLEHTFFRCRQLSYEIDPKPIDVIEAIGEH